jgi:hypothetical protein
LEGGSFNVVKLQKTFIQITVFMLPTTLFCLKAKYRKGGVLLHIAGSCTGGAPAVGIQAVNFFVETKAV